MEYAPLSKWRKVSPDDNKANNDVVVKKKICRNCEANRASLRCAGPFVLGPVIGSASVRSITQCLARRMGTNKFYSLKLLTLCDSPSPLHDQMQGKILMNNEFSLLSRLHDQVGVVHTHGLFEDEVEEPASLHEHNNNLCGKPKKYKRLCLVLDCLTAHDYNPTPNHFLTIQSYLIQQKRIPEKEALVIFLNLVTVVQELHKKNIVHRDLKIGNIVFNVRTKGITIINFCLGKQLTRNDELLSDQCGSPAFISPDILSGSPYCGKASDMWALGVVLYTMLYGQFPFYDTVPQELFRKIQHGDYRIPSDHRVSDEAVVVVYRLLTRDPTKRTTASDAVLQVQEIINSWHLSSILYPDTQIVPDVCDTENEEKKTVNSNPRLSIQVNTRTSRHSIPQCCTGKLTASSSIRGTARRLTPGIHNTVNSNTQSLRRREINTYRQRRNMLGRS